MTPALPHDFGRRHVSMTRSRIYLDNQNSRWARRICTVSNLITQVRAACTLSSTTRISPTSTAPWVQRRMARPPATPLLHLKTCSQAMGTRWVHLPAIIVKPRRTSPRLSTTGQHRLLICLRLQPLACPTTALVLRVGAGHQLHHTWTCPGSNPVGTRPSFATTWTPTKGTPLTLIRPTLLAIKVHTRVRYHEPRV